MENATEEQIDEDSKSTGKCIQGTTDASSRLKEKRSKGKTCVSSRVLENCSKEQIRETSCIMAGKFWAKGSARQTSFSNIKPTQI